MSLAPGRLRLVVAAGLAAIALTAALATVAVVRVWFSPPFFDVPPPHWMVVVPTLDLAAATCALATVITLGIAVVGSRRQCRQ